MNYEEDADDAAAVDADADAGAGSDFRRDSSGDHRRLDCGAAGRLTE